MKLLRDELTAKPLLIRFDREQPTELNGMLCLNEKGHFEFTWNGVGEDGRLVAECNKGYLAFDYVRPTPIMNVKPDQVTTYPVEIVFTNHKELVETTTYDRLKIKFENIFSGFKHNAYDPKAINLLNEIGMSEILIQGMKLEVFIGGSSSGSHFPARAEYVLDTLVVQLTSMGKIELSKVDRIIDSVTKVVALFASRPADPIGVELGIATQEPLYNYAYLEHSKPYTYATMPRRELSGLKVEDHAGDFIKCIKGAIEHGSLRELGLWFSYCEADYKKYYLDIIMSNLLSCAESAFYLLPKHDNSKRELEYDTMLAQIDPIDIRPAKLKKFIKDGKKAYADPITYETKILELIKYSGLDIGIKNNLAKYANQLRNNLMHGTEPNWDYIVDKDRKPVTPIHILEYMRTLNKIVSTVLKVHLKELTGKID